MPTPHLKCITKHWHTTFEATFSLKFNYSFFKYLMFSVTDILYLTACLRNWFLIYYLLNKDCFHNTALLDIIYYLFFVIFHKICWKPITWVIFNDILSFNSGKSVRPKLKWRIFWLFFILFFPLGVRNLMQKFSKRSRNADVDNL